MSRSAMIYVLLISLASPLNSGAAAWMSLDMSKHGDSRAMPNVMASAGHHAASFDAHRHPDPLAPPQHHTPHGNGHTEADCKAECLSCTNHSSSLAPLSHFCESQNKARVNTSSLAHPLTRFADLLLRPPILVSSDPE